jgi:GNAT superfamily N-acetyltransferase
MKSGTATGTDIRLRDANAGDAALLAQLHTESWRSAYAAILDPNYLAHEMEGERRTHWQAHLPAVLAGLGRILIAERDGHGLGFVCALRERDPDWGGYIDNLHVRPQLRGAGIGKVLLDAALGWLRSTGEARAYLWVYEANLPARGFYEREGWRNAEQMAAEDAPGGKGLMCCRYVRETGSGASGPM